MSVAVFCCCNDEGEDDDNDGEGIVNPLEV